MNAHELLAATQLVCGQIDNALLTERQSTDRVLALVAEAQSSLDVSDRLRHELTIVQSLVALKRVQVALERFKTAILATVQADQRGWQQAYD
jgi:hypothetical protein